MHVPTTDLVRESLDGKFSLSVLVGEKREMDRELSSDRQIEFEYCFDGKVPYMFIGGMWIEGSRYTHHPLKISKSYVF